MKERLKNIKTLSKLTSINNFIHLLLNQGTNVFVALIITPYLFQTLGEAKYGLVNLGLTVIMLFTILVNYGFHLNGPKRLALLKSDGHEKSKLINEVLFTRLIISVGLFFIIYTLIGLGFFSEYSQILLLAAIILFNEAVFPMFILQGLDKISWISKTNAVSKLLYLSFVLVLIQEPTDAKWVNFLFGSTALIVNLILLVIIYRAEGIKFLGINFRTITARLKENFGFFLSTIAGHISIHGGLVVLTNFVDDFQLGQYALAQRVAFLLRMIPVFIVQSVLQNATRIYERGEEDFKAYLKKTYQRGLLFTLVLGFLVAIASPIIIRIVGGEYVEYSERILRVLAFIPFLSMLNVENMIVILVAERKEILVKATWVTALFMILVSILASYHFGGMGLAIALLLTEFISYLIHTWLIKRNMRGENSSILNSTTL